MLPNDDRAGRDSLRTGTTGLVLVHSQKTTRPCTDDEGDTQDRHKGHSEPTPDAVGTVQANAPGYRSAEVTGIVTAAGDVEQVSIELIPVTAVEVTTAECERVSNGFGPSLTKHFSLLAS